MRAPIPFRKEETLLGKVDQSVHVAIHVATLTWRAHSVGAESVTVFVAHENGYSDDQSKHPA